MDSCLNAVQRVVRPAVGNGRRSIGQHHLQSHGRALAGGVGHRELVHAGAVHHAIVEGVAAGDDVAECGLPLVADAGAGAAATAIEGQGGLAAGQCVVRCCRSNGGVEIFVHDDAGRCRAATGLVGDGQGIGAALVDHRIQAATTGNDAGSRRPGVSDIRPR